MSKKQVTSGTKAKKTIVNIIIHIFLAILSFIWVLPIFWVILTSFLIINGRMSRGFIEIC